MRSQIPPERITGIRSINLTIPSQSAIPLFHSALNEEQQFKRQYPRTRSCLIWERCISKVFFSSKLFHEGGLFHIETSLLICSANQWTGFYMIDTCIMKELTTGHKKTRTFPYLPETFFNENYKKVKEQEIKPTSYTWYTNSW